MRRRIRCANCYSRSYRYKIKCLFIWLQYRHYFSLLVVAGSRECEMLSCIDTSVRYCVYNVVKGGRQMAGACCVGIESRVCPNRLWCVLILMLRPWARYDTFVTRGAGRSETLKRPTRNDKDRRCRGVRG